MQFVQIEYTVQPQLFRTPPVIYRKLLGARPDKRNSLDKRNDYINMGKNYKHEEFLELYSFISEILVPMNKNNIDKTINQNNLVQLIDFGQWAFVMTR